jgi:adenine deaminase
VTEPHEIANVAGVEGIRAMIAAGEDAPIDIYYGIPSSVPATNADLETTGGIITAEDMKALLDEDEVVCVGEVMNYREIIRPNHLEISKFIDYLKTVRPHFPIEGHCPQLLGLDLAKFLAVGIGSDHTEHDIEGFRQRFIMGMFVQIQEKTLSKELFDLIEELNVYEQFAFVTDDVMPDTLNRVGHLDHVIRRAIELGLKPEQAFYNASLTPARRMNLTDRGAIAPGKLADLVVLTDPETIAIDRVYKRGQCIFIEGEEAEAKEDVKASTFPQSFNHSIKLKPVTPAMFKNAGISEVDLASKTQVKVRVMQLNNGTTKTTEVYRTLPVVSGQIIWQDSDLLLAASLERYGKEGTIGFGFVTGDCHKRGAIATSYAHDNHNVLVAGKSTEAMALAVNRLIELQGGWVVTDHSGEEILEELPLPVAGIMADRPVEEVGERTEQVRKAIESLGYRHYNPFMSFGTLSLAVSPALKLTNKGLIDVKKGLIVPLVVE